MALNPGARLGCYEILAAIGVGGIGEVYLARDTKLGRDVAVKILSEELANAVARRRFQREAQMASALNHPHIVTVYDVGEHEGRQYLVTEYIDGGTLRQWARNEKRTWRQAVELLSGVADGLAVAHQAGILHRDIKPENILIMKSGYAKLADFGLAKLDPNALATDETPTLPEKATAPGLVIGTIAYMSPEQASGKPLDARADIFSFGLTLFELLAGHRAFSGTSNLELLQKIIHASPERLSEDIPAPLRALVEKALEKDPADRYQSMREMVVDLRRLLRQTTAEVIAEVPSTPVAPVNRRPWMMAASVAVAVLALAGFFAWRLVQSDYFWKNPLEGAKFEKLTDWEGTELDAAISHDGKFVTFLADRDGIYDTYVTQVGSGEIRNLTQGRIPTLLHEMTRTTGFTADSTQIWLRTTQTNLAQQPDVPNLGLVPTMGGPIRPFLTPASLNPVWSADGKLLVFHHSTPGDPIMLAEPDGRNERQILTGRPGEHNHFVTFSPDKRYIYFLRGWRSTEADVWRISTAGGTPERLTFHNSNVAYPVLLDNRTLLYRAAREDGGWAIYGMDTEHRIPRRLTQGSEEYQSLSASADGRRLVTSVSNPVANLWRVPISSGVAEESAVTRVRVPANQAKSGRYGAGGAILYLSGKGGDGGLWQWNGSTAVPLWNAAAGTVTWGASPSADGKWLAFAVRQNGRNVLHVASFDGTAARALTEKLDLRGSPSWSPDGQWIAVAADAGEGSRIFKVAVRSGEIVRLTDKLTFNGVWSPSGDRIVFYDGTVGGAIFPLGAVRPDGTALPMPEVRYRGDYEGYRFMPDGKSLVSLQGEFRAQDFWLLDLASGEHRRLTRLKPGYSIRSFDVSPDGKEILFDRLQENSDIVLIDRKP